MTRRWPRQPERRVLVVLTAGTGGSNSAPWLPGPALDAITREIPGSCNHLRGCRLSRVESFNKGVPRMTNQNQNNPNQKPGQQNQNPGQKPGQQQGAGQKPGQQQDPNRQGQNPNQQGKGGR